MSDPTQDVTTSSFLGAMRREQKFQETANVADFPVAAQGAEPSVLYTMMFLQGNQVRHKNFLWAGSLSNAIERAKKHCQIMRVRFLYCSPMVSDLSLDESRMNDIL